MLGDHSVFWGSGLRVYRLKALGEQGPAYYDVEYLPYRSTFEPGCCDSRCDVVPIRNCKQNCSDMLPMESLVAVGEAYWTQGGRIRVSMRVRMPYLLSTHLGS